MSEKPLDLEGMNIYKKLKVDFGSGRTKIIYDEKEAIKEIKQRIKSAVKGLLEELKLECKPYDFIEVRNKKLSYEQIKQLIKKYFPDEVKENE